MHFTLHLTTSCNMRCDYCYAAPSPGPAMTESVAAAALALAARMSTGPIGIVFFGGEPLLCRELIESTVAEARRMEARGLGSFHFKVTTNGLLVDSALLEFAIREDVHVALSLDGVRAAHDAHRRKADGGASFDCVLPALREVLAARPYSNVLSVVSPDTASHLGDSVEMLLGEGCRTLIVSLDYSADWSEEQLDVLQAQYRKLARLYVSLTRQGRKFYLSPFEVKLSSHVNQHRFPMQRCEMGSRQLSVDPEGWIFPCVQFPQAGRQSPWCIGHVAQGVDEAARERIRAMSKLQKEPCRECAIQARCQHTCGCLNWQATGEISRVAPVLCRSERMLMPIVDGIGAELYAERNPHFLQKHYNAAWPLLSLIEDAGVL
jgi:uncharacterized protein